VRTAASDDPGAWYWVPHAWRSREHRGLHMFPTQPVVPLLRTATVNLSLYCHVAQAAELAGVSDRQVRNAIKDGRIEATKVGHVWMVLRSSAQSFQRVPGMGRPTKAKKAAGRKKPAKQR